MVASYIQTNLPQFTQPHVEESYKPRVQKRPGTIAEWTEFTSRVAQLSELLYRDARVLRSKRADAHNARPGSIAQREAERDFAAMLKRSTEHCRQLANLFLASGMPREHLENHLEQCGTEGERRPSYEIAVLYSKLLGLEFQEERTIVTTDDQGNEVTEKKVERKRYCWASRLKPAEVDDFFLTMRALNECLPPLATRFRRGEISL